MVSIGVSVFTLGIGGLVVWIIAGTRANATKEKAFLEKGWSFVGYENEVKKVEQ